MNITMDELSLKKVKFGAEPASTTVEAPAPVESNPEKGMNALTFMGIRNLMSNPKLAQEVGVPTEEPKSEPNADAKSYVAPYSSNIAFLGVNPKTASKAIKLGAAALAAQGILSSCIKQEVYAEIDMTAMYDLAAKFQQYMDQQDAFSKMFMEKFMQLLADVEEMKNDGKSQMEADQHFYNEMLKYMLMSVQNQEYIKLLLQKNGKTEEESKKILEQILAEFNSIGNDSEKARALLNKILAMLGLINDNLVNLINQAKNIAKEIKNMTETLHNDNKQSLEYIVQLNLKLTEYKNYLNEISGKLSTIDGSIDDLAEQIGISKSELFELLNQLGISIIDAQKMSTQEIVMAIKSVEAAVKVLTGAVQYYALQVEQGLMSIEEYNKLIAGLLGDLNNNAISILNELKNKYGNDAAMLAMLNKIYDRLGDLLNGQEAGLEEAGRMTFILNKIYTMLENGLPMDKIDIIIDLLSKGNVNMEKLMNMVCALNQNYNEGRAENRQFVAEILAKFEKLIAQGDIHTEQLNKLLDKAATIIGIINSLSESSGEQAEALRNILISFMNLYTDGNQQVIDAIANIKLDDSGCNFDVESLRPVLDALNAILNELKAVGADVTAIKNAINLVASSVESINVNVAAVNNLLMQHFDKFMEKYDEIIDTIKKHKCCECNCNGNDHNEGVINDLTNVFNS